MRWLHCGLKSSVHNTKLSTMFLKALVVEGGLVQEMVTCLKVDCSMLTSTLLLDRSHPGASQLALS